MKAILDATPIIAFFDELRDPETLLLLRQLGYELLAPEYICQEEILSEPSAGRLRRCIELGQISTLPKFELTQLTRFMNTHPSFGIGESEVILHAVSFRLRGIGVLCVLDEKMARKVAAGLGLPIKGTIGIINLLAASQLITPEAEKVLKGRLLGSSFRMDKKLLK